MIAIVGMACRLPDEMRPELGDQFECEHFGLTSRAADALDAAQRVVLEVTYDATLDATIPLPALRARSAGVFLGAAPRTAARLARVLGVSGPCIAVDTGVSSTLVALHAACESLREGACDVAIAGGVVVDQDCSVLVLVRLADAERDGDRIRAVIRGTAIGVADDASRSRVTDEALQVAGLTADRVQHATACDAASLSATVGALDADAPAGLVAVGGMIGYAVVEAAAREPAARATETNARATRGDPYVLVVSATTADALPVYATRYADALERSDDHRSYRDIAYSASVRGTHQPHRLAVVGDSAHAWAERLRAFARGEPAARLVTGVAPSVPPRVAMVFSGQGGQWCAMGRELYAREPVFRATIDRIAALIDPQVTWKLHDELGRDETTDRMGETQVAQPALFAVQVALFELLRSWGVSPDAVIGHSVGEVAAAYAAGVLTLDAAARLVVQRSKIMQKATGLGRMAAVALSPVEAETLVAGAPGVEIAASNGPSATVVSGEPAALERVLAEVRARGVEARELRVEYASHNSQMDGLGRELTDVLRGLEPRPPVLPLISTLTGDVAPPLDATYWGDQVRKRVRFLEATQRLARDGIEVFVEVGPHPILLPAVDHTLEDLGKRATLVPTLRRKEPEAETMQVALGALHVVGYPIDWTRQYATPGQATGLPGYPWRWSSEAAETVADDDAPGTARAATTSRVVSPGAIKQFLRSTISTLCRLPPDKIGPNVTFAALGLDSLLTISLRDAVQRELGVTVPTAMLYGAPTVSSLSAWILRTQTGAPEPARDAPATTTTSSEAPLPSDADALLEELRNQGLIE